MDPVPPQPQPERGIGGFGMRKGICYIVGAGVNFGLDFLPTAEDLVIAADGGLTALQQADICPDLVIGDFDSLGHVPVGKDVVVLPKVKDVTDTWAAVEQGKERGHTRFFLYGCTGGRFDHTLANIQTAANSAAQGLECRIFDQNQVITALSGKSLFFPSSQTGFLSLFAHSDRCTGVTLRGLRYELEQAELTNRFPLGISNEFLGKPSSVTVDKGICILVYER